MSAIREFRNLGKTVVLITHRTSAIGVTNKLLLLNNGVAQMFGPTAQVLADLGSAAKHLATPPKSTQPLKQVPTTTVAQVRAAE